tara:strand:- start:3997 stop:4362 length:366 start_codon:yes stop_codon:yes gene_type:complete
MTHTITDQDKEAITSVKRKGNTSWNMRFFECGGGDIGETVQWYLSDGKRITEENSFEFETLANFLRTFREYENLIRTYNDEFLGGSEMTTDDVLFCVMEAVDTVKEKHAEHGDYLDDEDEE